MLVFQRIFKRTQSFCKKIICGTYGNSYLSARSRFELLKYSEVRNRGIAIALLFGNCLVRQTFRNVRYHLFVWETVGVKYRGDNMQKLLLYRRANVFIPKLRRELFGPSHLACPKHIVVLQRKVKRTQSFYKKDHLWYIGKFTSLHKKQIFDNLPTNNSERNANFKSIGSLTNASFTNFWKVIGKSQERAGVVGMLRGT